MTAVALDVFAANGISSATSLTMTIGNNPNRCLFVMVGGDCGADTNHITSVKIGNIDLTNMFKQRGNGGSNSCDCDVWYLINPPTGSITITVGVTGAQLATVYNIMAWSMYHVDQKTPYQNIVSSTGTATSETVTVTASNANSALIAGFYGVTILPYTHTPGSYVTDYFSGNDLQNTREGSHIVNPTVGSFADTCSSMSGTVNWSNGGFEVLPVSLTPTLLTAKPLSSSSIFLSWTQPTFNLFVLTGYLIERSTDNGITWITVNANSDPTSTTFSDNSLLNNTTYMYRVTALNPFYSSPASVTAIATTLNTVNLPCITQTSFTTASFNTLSIIPILQSFTATSLSSDFTETSQSNCSFTQWSDVCNSNYKSSFTGKSFNLKGQL